MGKPRKHLEFALLVSLSFFLSSADNVFATPPQNQPIQSIDRTDGESPETNSKLRLLSPVPSELPQNELSEKSATADLLKQYPILKSFEQVSAALDAAAARFNDLIDSAQISSYSKTTKELWGLSNSGLSLFDYRATYRYPLLEQDYIEALASVRVARKLIDIGSVSRSPGEPTLDAAQIRQRAQLLARRFWKKIAPALNRLELDGVNQSTEFYGLVSNRIGMQQWSLLAGRLHRLFHKMSFLLQEPSCQQYLIQKQRSKKK